MNDFIATKKMLKSVKVKFEVRENLWNGDDKANFDVKTIVVVDKDNKNSLSEWIFNQKTGKLLDFNVMSTQ